jgi:hypothetical protein
MALGLPPKKKFKAKNTKLKPGAQIHATVPWYTMKRAPGISCSGSACGHDFGMGICHPNFSKSSVSRGKTAMLYHVMPYFIAKSTITRGNRAVQLQLLPLSIEPWWSCDRPTASSWRIPSP